MAISNVAGTSEKANIAASGWCRAIRTLLSLRSEGRERPAQWTARNLHQPGEGLTHFEYQEQRGGGRQCKDDHRDYEGRIEAGGKVEAPKKDGEAEHPTH